MGPKSSLMGPLTRSILKNLVVNFLPKHFSFPPPQPPDRLVVNSKRVATFGMFFGFDVIFLERIGHEQWMVITPLQVFQTVRLEKMIGRRSRYLLGPGKCSWGFVSPSRF